MSIFTDNPALEQYLGGMQKAIDERDIISVFDNLLTIATEAGCSDIHIEPGKDMSRIRLRIDGVLRELIQYPARLHDNVIAKFKIES